MLGDRLQQLSMSFYKRRNPGDLAAVILQDVSNVESILGHTLPSILAAIFGTVIISTVLFILNWQLALILLIALPLAYIFVWITVRAIGKLGQKHVKSRNDTGSSFVEYLFGIRHLKAFNQTGDSYKTLKDIFEKLRKNSILVEAIPGPFIVLGFIIFELAFLTMIYFAQKMLYGTELDIQTFIIFLLLGYKLYEPLKLVMIDFAILRYMNVSLNRIIDLMKSPLQDKGKNLTPTQFDVSFNGVSFSYVNRVVLNNINLNIPANQLTALVGMSGSGKSTITNLIARFWDVQKGQITIGGIDIKDIAPQTVYSLISEVFQDVYLFNDTIYNNIKIGKPGATKEEILKVIEKAQVIEFLPTLEAGIETLVGEGGSHLSGGQKQRISIARAMLKDAPIVLLDEATAALDPENDIYIQQAIQELVQNKTVVVIAHKLRTICDADNIVVLNDGVVVEQGKHDYLLAENGLYNRLWTLQQQKMNWKL